MESQGPDYVLEEYEIEMPESVRGIVALVEATLVMGGVQEIVIHQGSPIRVKRYVTRNSVLRGVAPVARNYSQEIRTIQRIEEIIAEKNEAPASLVSSLIARTTAQPGLHPVGIFCRSRSWLFRELFPGTSPEARILGLEVLEVEDLPADVLLVGGAAADGLPLTYAAKVVLDLGEVEETPVFGSPPWS